MNKLFYINFESKFYTQSKWKIYGC